MISKTQYAWRAAAVIGAGAALAGCMGPTYGTGQTSGQQLIDDLDNIVSFAEPRGPQISYEPRPELVRPDNKSVLPAPQATRRDAASEQTPEARRARLQRDAAVADRGGPVSPELAAARSELRSAGAADDVQDDTNFGATQFPGQRRNDFVLSPQELNASGQAFRQRIADNRGSPTQRRSLSEPPVTYRQPAASAPAGDPGIDERVKAARLKREENSIGAKIRNLLPF